MSDAIRSLNAWALPAIGATRPLHRTPVLPETALRIFAAGWITAAWQGGVALALVWAACRLFPRLSTGARCWLWRLAYLKLLVALVWVAPVALPLLPALSAPAPAIDLAPAPLLPAARMQVHTPHAAAVQPEPLAFGWFLLWIAGAALVSLKIAREWHASRSLVRRGQPVMDERWIAAGAALACRFGLHRPPELLLSEEIDSPVLAGAIRPALLLPPSLLAALSAEETTALIAHELAHLKRRDLLWAWLPALARVLFFAHPLVWWTGREWRLAQEIACDEMAVRLTGTPPAAYGQAVLKVAARRPRGWAEPAALRAAGAYQDLRRRFLALQQIRPAARRPWRLAGALLAALGGALLVPWRLTAQTARTRPAPLASDRAPGGAETSRIVEEERRLQAMQRELGVERARNNELYAQIASLTRVLAAQREQGEARPRRSGRPRAMRAVHESLIARLRAEEAATQLAIGATAGQQKALRSQLEHLAARLHALAVRDALQRRIIREHDHRGPSPPAHPSP